MQSSLNSSRISFLTGCLLINSICLVLVIASLSFFANAGIAGWQYPVAFVLSGIVSYFVSKRYFESTGVFVKAVLIALAVVVLCVVIAINLYDVSYDGQSYHQEGIYQLKNGWNPAKTSLPETVNMAIYINHYSKGVEVPQSTLYALTNHIEAGKATNFILLAAVFCLVLSYLISLNRLSLFKSILISLIATLNPIAVNQLISTYVDGQLAVLLLCFFITALWIVRNASITNLLLLGSIIIITANIKFTGLVYMVMFSFLLLAWLLYTKAFQLFKKTLYTAILSGIVAVFIVGYNPYVVNTVKFKHPFYPLMGSNKVDIIGYNLPNGFEGRSGTNKFFTSLFAHTDNPTSGNGKTVQLKVPFSFNKSDIINASKIDTRIAGFGPLFSGLLILSFIVVVILFNVPGDKQLFRNALYVISMLMISAFIIPESWWARYIPQLWYVPVIVLLILELYHYQKLKALKLLLYLLLLLNISFTFIGLGWNVMMTTLVNYQMARLKGARQTVTVQWGSAKANRIRFMEYGIPFTEKILDGVPNTENIVRSDSKFIIPDTAIKVPKSKIVLWAEKFQQPIEK